MTDKNTKRKALGRGLSALMADIEPSRTPEMSEVTRGVMSIPIESIEPNPDQPRKKFFKDDLDDLARSIVEKGIIQPLIVRKIDDKNDKYQIVAGERRWRAAQIARIHSVPVIVREFSDLEVLEENNFRYYINTVCGRSQPFINKGEDQNMDLQLNIFGIKRNLNENTDCQ